MKRARIRYRDEIYPCRVEDNGELCLEDGRLLQEQEVTWLPPDARTVFALGLNYANHAKELAFTAPTEPLVFLKAHNTLIGHRQHSIRPDHVDYMHYEAELVVVIGRTARNVSRESAMDYVGGYTVANDYAVRDYLENYYRPNLRVKSRDTLTPVGPWIVDAADLENPHDLNLWTWVNGELRQQGNTRDLIFDIPYLVSYLSRFMTLQPRDLILTGTPEGLSNVQPGDEVVVEVQGVGRLSNTLISESDYLGRAEGARERD